MASTCEAVELQKVHREGQRDGGREGGKRNDGTWKGRKETLPSLPSFSVYFPSAMTSERATRREGGTEGGGLLQHHSACLL